MITRDNYLGRIKSKKITFFIRIFTHSLSNLFDSVYNFFYSTSLSKIYCRRRTKLIRLRLRGISSKFVGVVEIQLRSTRTIYRTVNRIRPSKVEFLSTKLTETGSRTNCFTEHFKREQFSGSVIRFNKTYRISVDVHRLIVFDGLFGYHESIRPDLRSEYFPVPFTEVTKTGHLHIFGRFKPVHSSSASKFLLELISRLHLINFRYQRTLFKGFSLFFHQHFNRFLQHIKR